MSTINEKIRLFRNRMHLSQEYVADYLNMNRASYCQLENGKRKVSAQEISYLSKLFAVSADAILNDESEEISLPIFARTFDNLDEKDKAEIMNLIHFKEQMKNQKVAQ